MRLNMTFEEATNIMKNCDPYGQRSVLKGCEHIKEMIAGHEDWHTAEVTLEEITAFRIVCREMRKLFV